MTGSLIIVLPHQDFGTNISLVLTLYVHICQFSGTICKHFKAWFDLISLYQNVFLKFFLCPKTLTVSQNQTTTANILQQILQICSCRKINLTAHMNFQCFLYSHTLRPYQILQLTDILFCSLLSLASGSTTTIHADNCRFITCSTFSSGFWTNPQFSPPERADAGWWGLLCRTPSAEAPPASWSVAESAAGTQPRMWSWLGSDI